MHILNISGLAGAALSSLFLLAALSNDAEAQAAPQQVPAFVATLGIGPDGQPDTLANMIYSAQGTLSSCPNSSEDGPYAVSGSSSDQQVGLLVSQISILLIQQGGNWIPASGTVQPSAFPKGYVGEYMSALSASGTVTSSGNQTFSGINIGGGAGSPSVGPENGSFSEYEVVDLTGGNYATFTSSTVYTLNFTNADGCTGYQTGQAVYTGTAPIVLTPYTPEASITLRDPTNVGGQILPLTSSVDPNSVPDAPGANGIAADGVSAAAIVYNSFSSQPLTLTLTGVGTVTGTVPGGSIGTLTDYVADYLSNPEPGSGTTIQLTDPLDATTCNSDTDQAGTSQCAFLALLWAPAKMPYSTSTPESVSLTITANQTDANGVQGSTSAPAVLEAPPLVLVHGIWDSSSGAWPTFIPSMQQSGYPTSNIVAANYSAFNSLTFENPGTQQILAQSIADALTNAAREGIVARKVDVVSHSMGGLVTLYFVDQFDQGTPPQSVDGLLVTLPENPIHKLVAIAMPHGGSPLATTLWNIRNNAPPFINPLFSTLCTVWGLNPCTPVQLFGKINHPIDTGVESLQRGVSSLSITYPYSAIVGETGGLGATEDILDDLLNFWVPGDTVAGLLGPFNDTIVPAGSQSSNSTDSVTVIGVVHTSLWPNVPWIPEFNSEDFPSETRSSAVFTEALSSLMGNPLSGTVTQSQVVNSTKRLGPTPEVTHSLRSAARPETPLASQQKALRNSQ